jgi:hypothetical protein
MLHFPPSRVSYVSFNCRSRHAARKANRAVTQKQPFEVPQQLRDLAESNVEQGRAAYTQFMDAMTQATSMWMGAMPANEMTSAVRLVQERSLRFAKQNADAYFAFVSEMATARDVQDALAIQARFTQQQMHAYTLQAQEIARLSGTVAQNMNPKI